MVKKSPTDGTKNFLYTNICFFDNVTFAGGLMNIDESNNGPLLFQRLPHGCSRHNINIGTLANFSSACVSLLVLYNFFETKRSKKKQKPKVNNPFA